MKEIYECIEVLFPSNDFSFEKAGIKKHQKISKQLAIESRLLEMKETNAQLKKMNEPIDLFDLFEGTIGSRFDLYTINQNVVSLWPAPSEPQLSTSELLLVAIGLRNDLESGVRNLFEQDYWKELIFLTRVIHQLQRELFEEWRTNVKSELHKAMRFLHGLLKTILVSKEKDRGNQLGIHIPRIRKVITGNSIDDENGFEVTATLQNFFQINKYFQYAQKRKNTLHPIIR